MAGKLAYGRKEKPGVCKVTSRWQQSSYFGLVSGLSNLYSFGVLFWFGFDLFLVPRLKYILLQP